MVSRIVRREFLKGLWSQLSKNEVFLRASAVAYYALTALVPFLAVILTLAAKLIPDISGSGKSSVGIGGLTVEEFLSTLSRMLPAEAFQVVAEEIARIQKQPPVGLLSVGLIISLWLASSLFGTVIDALNRIHGVAETRSYAKITLVAIALTAIEAVIILGGLIVLVVWPQIRGWFGWDQPPHFGEVILEWAIVGGAMLLSFSAISYLGPSTHSRWKWITPGSLLATPTLLLSALLLRIYAKDFGNYSKTYGSLAGVMLLSFWFWIAAVIVLTSVQIDKLLEDKQETDS